MKSRQGGNQLTKEEQVPTRNPNDAILSDELNKETAKLWCPTKGRTYQRQNRIYNEDIAMF